MDPYTVLGVLLLVVGVSTLGISIIGTYLRINKQEDKS